MIFIRSLLFNVWFFGMTMILGFYGIGLRWFAPRRTLGLARLWARCVLAGARVLCGIEAKVTGAEHLATSGPILIASQHQSAFDTLIWLQLLPRASYVFKQELARIPLFGPLLRPAGQILVNRGAGANALRSLLREAKHAQANNRQIVIFPEGTRTRFGEDLPLHPGVVALSKQLALPVLPVATDSGRRWKRHAFLKTPGPVQIHIMPPIQLGLSRDELVTQIKQSWAEAGLEARQA
jgi:1-acyl-sn-glycerol-3-phosphate acyltransferase